jgi:hypothetical protein
MTGTPCRGDHSPSRSCWSSVLRKEVSWSAPYISTRVMCVVCGAHLEVVFNMTMCDAGERAGTASGTQPSGGRLPAFAHHQPCGGSKQPHRAEAATKPTQVRASCQGVGHGLILIGCQHRGRASGRMEGRAEFLSICIASGHLCSVKDWGLYHDVLLKYHCGYPNGSSARPRVVQARFQVKTMANRKMGNGRGHVLVVSNLTMWALVQEHLSMWKTHVTISV